MNNLRVLLFISALSVLQLTAQNQLPIVNGEFEIIDGNNNFYQWTHQANNGGDANFSIETSNLIAGSTKALKSEIHSLGANGWHVSSKSEYPFQVLAGQKYTVTFYAKIYGADSRQMKLVFQSEVSGSYQGQNISITDEWKRYSHTFTVGHDSDINQVRFWYMSAGVTYYLDEVSISPGERVTFDQENKFQTIDGFGGGIKRKTEQLYALDDSLREEIEAYCFQDLEVNMIRFFVYHDLEPSNDNNDPYTLDESQLDWTRYDSDPTQTRTRYVAEALQNAFNLSSNGFDHIIGNCNSAPGWLKTNGQHNNGGTLIPGGESEFSEFLIAFLQGMKSRYDIEVTEISPTNEPDYEVSYESMNTPPSQLSNIILNLNTRLASEDLDHIKIISPECFRVETSNNSSVSTTNYINSMFASSVVESAVDVVATHTYADSNHNANWNSLKVAAVNKPVWVTESANLNSTDQSMTDAANYIKWMLRGFNEGGMTAYMVHLFYEEADASGYSSLVAWDSSGNIILPKRYHSFKHFANLIKKGYQLIGSQAVTVQGNLMVGAFKSPDQSKIVLQIFNEGDAQEVSVDVPIGATNVSHYVTSDASGTNFSIQNDVSFDFGDRYTSLQLPSLSFHSLVYDIDTSVLSLEHLDNSLELDKIIAYPNPTKEYITLKFPTLGDYSIEIYHIDGKKIIERSLNDVKIFQLNVSSLSKGVYIVKIVSKTKDKKTTIKFIKEK